MKQVSSKTYFDIFQSKGHSFISKEFITLNAKKVDELIFIVDDELKASIGLILGVKGKTLLSPFSAPFGGFHYAHENIYFSKIENFISELKDFFLSSEFESFKCVLPPSIYGSSFNSKLLNASFRNGFILDSIDLTSFVDLFKFDYRFTTRNSREYYKQATKNHLQLKEVFTEFEKGQIIDIIRVNRESQNRKLNMSLQDFLKMEDLWKVDYLAVINGNSGEIISGGVFYRLPETEIVYIAVWGDSEKGRPLRAMDFLLFEVWSYYKKLNFRFIDLGISTEGKGEVNEGLLRFKETHEAITEPRFVLTLEK